MIGSETSLRNELETKNQRLKGIENSQNLDYEGKKRCVS